MAWVLWARYQFYSLLYLLDSLSLDYTKVGRDFDGQILVPSCLRAICFLFAPEFYIENIISRRKQQCDLSIRGTFLLYLMFYLVSLI